MAERITAAEYIKENPNATLEDFKKAAGRAVTAIEEGIFKARENYLKNADSGVTNSEGKKSLAENPVVQKVASAINKEKLEEATQKGKAKIIELEEKAKDFYNELEGKDKKEQENIYWERFKPESAPLENVFNQIEKKDKPENKTETKPEETPKESGKATERRNAFLESWAATHPTWGQILRDKNLTWGQKVSLIGSALANIGANVTLGMKSGFEHSGFTPVEWDFKKAVDKYSNQEIENVLNAEQKARAQELYANLFADMAEKYGDEKMQEIFAIADAYGDNPAQLKARLEAIGVKEDANAIKEAYKNREKISAEEQAKREKLDTEIKQAQAEIARLEAVMKTLDKEQKEALNKKIIEAQEAIQDYTKTKYKSDTKTYNLEKTAGYIHNIIKEAEGIAGTVGGVLTGGVVGSTSSIKDGIVRAKGIPQKIVRADGSEVMLSPYDNIYATEKPLTTENDNGGEVVPMELKDEVYFQKRLGYSGGVIRKDFDYYLNILGA